MLSCLFHIVVTKTERLALLCASISGIAFIVGGALLGWVAPHLVAPKEFFVVAGSVLLFGVVLDILTLWRGRTEALPPCSCCGPN